MKRRILRVLEVLFLVTGTALLVFTGFAYWEGWVASRTAIRDFEVAASESAAKVAKHAAQPVARPVPMLPRVDPTDFSLWSAARIRAYRQSLTKARSLPLAILQIPRIHLRVAVFNGTDDLTLNRGAGRIEGTAWPGDGGNIGIAAHRDGFFRGLKDVSIGDTVQLRTLDETLDYVIDRIEIVPPSDVGVLAPRPRPSLTLVTCYPFYYIGSAPKRYVVEASLKSEPRKGITVSSIQRGVEPGGKR